MSEYQIIRSLEREIILSEIPKNAPALEFPFKFKPQVYPLPRMLIFYIGDVPDMKATRPISHIAADLQNRLYVDLRRLRVCGQDDPSLLRAIQPTMDAIRRRIAAGPVIAKDALEMAAQPFADSDRFPTAADDALAEQFRRINQKIFDPDFHRLEFRQSLISNLLDEFELDLDQLNSAKYQRNIGIDHSFIARAEPIFSSAEEVFAVSMDSYSPFWLSENVDKQVARYISIQKPNTVRVFVFSSARSMLSHRWVMDEHYKVYGKTGAVLYTDSSSWNSYLNRLATDADSEGRAWLKKKRNADFGILVYRPFGVGIYYEATLSADNLSFHRIEQPNDVQNLIMAELCQISSNRCFDSGEVLAYRWDPEFSTNNEYWYAAVDRSFPNQERDDVSQRIAATHILLFSKRLSSKGFPEKIRSIMPALMNIKSADGRMLVKSVWYGSSHEGAEPRDPQSGGPLRLSQDLIEKWPHCLIMDFVSAADLHEYYENDEHGRVRRYLYESFSPEISELLSIADGFKADSSEKLTIASALEQLVSQFMKRLDFVSEDRHGEYESVEAPRPGHRRKKAF